MWPRLVVASLVVLVIPQHSAAFDAILLKESAGADANLGTPCLLSGNTNGTAANYRWYNVCSGYIWIYAIPDLAGEGGGVLFGGEQQPEVRGDNDVKRAITYWRNVLVAYNQTVDVFVNVDNEGDGCLDALLASDLNVDPGLRWNCSDFNVDIPCGTTYLIVRAQTDGGAAPNFATDGPSWNDCNQNPTERSYYYGINGSACVRWSEWAGAGNLLYWLILDTSESCLPNATAARSWGAIKDLYR